MKATKECTATVPQTLYSTTTKSIWCKGCMPTSTHLGAEAREQWVWSQPELQRKTPSEKQQTTQSNKRICLPGMGRACNLGTQQAVAGRFLQVQGHSGLHSQLKANADYMVRPYLKKWTVRFFFFFKSNYPELIIHLCISCVLTQHKQ